MTDSNSGSVIDKRALEQAVDRLAAPMDKLAAAFAPKPPTGLVDDPLALRAEYQAALEIIKLLSDLRFRCLTFVTAVTAVATAFAANANADMRPALGALGLLATLGITVYELRNSQLYEVAVHRAKTLEACLRMMGGRSGIATAGLFGERPPYVQRPPAEKKAADPLMRFWLVPVKHDHGLALIYGAALGAWAFLFVYGLLALPVPAGLWPSLSAGYVRLASGACGIVACGWTIYLFIVHDRNRLKTPLPGSSKSEGKTDAASIEVASAGGSPSAVV